MRLLALALVALLLAGCTPATNPLDLRIGHDTLSFPMVR